MAGPTLRRELARWAALTGVPLLMLTVLLFAPAPVAATDVSTALLSDTDLPSGWKVLGGAAEVPGNYAWCPSDEALPATPLARAARSFSSDSINPILYHHVLVFDAGGAAGALAAVRARPDGCTWEEASADAVPMRFDLSAAEELALGDEAFQRRLEATWEGMVVRAEIIIVRRGDSIAILTQAAVGQGASATDPRLTRRLAERAAVKLSTVSTSR